MNLTQNKIDKMIADKKARELDKNISKYNNCVSFTNVLKSLIKNPDNYEGCVNGQYKYPYACHNHYIDCLEFEEFKSQNNNSNNQIKIDVIPNNYNVVNSIRTKIDTNNNTITYVLRHDNT